MDLEAYLIENGDLVTIHYSKTKLGDLYRQIGGQTPREGVQLLASLTFQERRVVEDACLGPNGRGHLVALQILDTRLNKFLRLVLFKFKPEVLNRRFNNARMLLVLINKVPQDGVPPTSRTSFERNRHGWMEFQRAHFPHKPLRSPPSSDQRPSLLSPRLPIPGTTTSLSRSSTPAVISSMKPSMVSRMWPLSDDDRKSEVISVRTNYSRKVQEKMMSEPVPKSTSEESLSSFHATLDDSVYDDEDGDESETERARRHIERLFTRWTPVKAEDSI